MPLIRFNVSAASIKSCLINTPAKPDNPYLKINPITFVYSYFMRAYSPSKNINCLYDHPGRQTVRNAFNHEHSSFNDSIPQKAQNIKTYIKSTMIQAKLSCLNIYQPTYLIALSTFRSTQGSKYGIKFPFV